MICLSDRRFHIPMLFSRRLRREAEDRAKKRPVGRPRKNNNTTLEVRDKGIDKKPAKEKKRMNWFKHPSLIEEIMKMCQVKGSHREAVRVLQLRNPNLFGRLRHNTVMGWFVDNGFTTLKPNYQKALDESKSARGPAAQEMFGEHATLRTRVIDRLQHHRDAGARITIPVIKCIMESEIKKMNLSSILHKYGGRLKLSPTFCRAFVTRY